MVAAYAHAWKQNCTPTDMRFIELDLGRWLLRPRIQILQPSSSSMKLYDEVLDYIYRSMCLPKEYLEGTSGTTALVSTPR